jgi:hypothetical protein
LRAAEEILNIPTLSLIIRPTEERKWNELDYLIRRTPSWCELPRVAVTPSPSKERRTLLQNRQSAICFRTQKAKRLTREEAGRSYISVKRHISFHSSNGFWSPPWDAGRFGPRPLCSCLWVSINASATDASDSWRAVEMAMATRWRASESRPRPSLRHVHAQLGLIGSTRPFKVKEIGGLSYSWGYLCDTLSLKPACWNWPLRICNISTMPPCN